MSRSAADATRFTATGPYVSSKPASTTPYKLPGGMTPRKGNKSSSSGSSNHLSGGGGGETPRQKVERLRAEARAARLAQSTSTFDRMLEGGRKVANRAHKVMIYTLIAASGVCGALTVYSVVSLAMYNRRQRNLWLDRQLQDLQAAREAYAANTATAEQLEILRNEKVGEIEKRIRDEAREQRLWNRAKRYLFDGLKKEDVSTGSSVVATSTSTSELRPVGVMDALDNAKRAEAATAASLSSSSSSSSSIPQPGPLDVLAANAETTAKQSARSWRGWIWGQS